jgi:cytochrome c-type biogenesis protein CcmF
VAIRRAPGEDLYIVLAGYDVSSQTATYAVTVNPLVNWIWLGFGIMAIGTGIALLPESAFAFASARVPAGAVTTSLILLLLLLPAAANAQETVSPVKRTALFRQMEGQLMCMCGCRAPMNNCPMGPTCHGLQDQQPKLEAMVARGMDATAIKAAFAGEYGEQVLLEPPNRGFNRLAWLFPYLMGAAGLMGIGVVAWRWSRSPAEQVSPGTAPQTNGEDAELKERLDDELRDLD